MGSWMVLAMAAGPASDARPTAETMAALAAKDLGQMLRDGKAEDARQSRYISWHAIPAAKLSEARKAASVWIAGHLSTAPGRIAPADVPGSAGRLQRLDLRDYRWNRDAWRAVALREPFSVEPAIRSETAIRLRDAIGEVQDPKTLHVVAMVRGDWLLRDTMESDRSTSYYDLLFAGKRFVRETPPRPPRRPGERPAPPAPSRLKTTSFPENEDEWNDFFGVKAIVESLRKQRLDPERGAVVAGSRDDPIRGSIVARNNRVVLFVQTASGVAMKTFDTDTTSGEFDYLEGSKDVPRLVQAGKLKAKAGELLASLPSGGQAGLLVNGEGKRTEKAPPDFAVNSADARYKDVRTMMGCVQCHAPDNGLIPPKDMVREALRAGLDAKFKDRDERNAYRAFFLDWDSKVAGWQAPYKAMVADLGRDALLDAEGKPWTGAQFATALIALRDRYDDPVRLEQMACECGTTVAKLKAAAVKSPKARLGLIALGKPIPRDTWDRDVFREAMLLLDAMEKERSR